MLKRKLQDVLGVLLLGDAVVHALRPKDHVRLWQTRGAPNSLYNRVLGYFIDHPSAIALASVGEIALGAALAWRAEKPVAEAA